MLAPAKKACPLPCKAIRGGEGVPATAYKIASGGTAAPFGVVPVAAFASAAGRIRPGGLPPPIFRAAKAALLGYREGQLLNGTLFVHGREQAR